ncbi:MAG: sensor histidine kinase [Burkholderiaceae bacterium]
MESAQTPQEKLSSKPSLLARYRAWERRAYSRTISDPQDLAGMDAYADYFYSWRGWWIHVVELLLATGLALLARDQLDLPLWLGVPVGYVLITALASFIILAWYTPRFYAKTFKVNLVKIVPLMLAGVIFGVIAGATAKALQTKGRIPTVSEFADILLRASQEPVVWLATGGVLLWAALLAGVARARRHQLEQENALLQAASERDQAARAAAEAQLKVLQVQIKPHFLFNTLAAMQHWVDSKDERAGPLLRNLTQFLRQSVQALDKPTVTVAEEFELVNSYLAIMTARMGARLTYTLTHAPEIAAQPIAPGMVLTLTENALEHGITPALRGGHVDVTAGRDGAHWWIEVTDTGVGFSEPPQFNVGLRNTQERLDTLYGTAARFSLHRDEVQGKTIARIDYQGTLS